jgi:hypothetical protein
MFRNDEPLAQQAFHKELRVLERWPCHMSVGRQAA